MTKMTKRILSSVLTVLMIVSMVAVFTLPAAMAVEAPKTTDYEAIYEDAYLINPEWHDGELITDKLLYFTFQGVEREVVCDPEKHFNSWADAYEAVYGIGKMDASNIYTKKPVFIFAPGTYNELIHLPANATVMGNNAGISPNADMAEGDWTADSVKENNGWKKNDARVEETIFTYGFYPSTRTGAEHTEEDATGADDSRFAYYLETGKPASNATITVEIDGVKVLKTGSGHVFTMHHYDKGKPVKYPASAAEVSVTSGRICNLIARNSVLDTVGCVFYSNNAAYNNVKGYIYDCELTHQNAQIAQRDLSVLTMERVYWHHSGTSASIANNSNLLGYNSVYYSSVYKTSDINIKNCVFYELAGGDSLFKVGSNYDRFHGAEGDANRKKSLTHNVNFNGNIFYNAKSTSSPSAANVINVVDYDESSSVKVNITNNIFHQEGKYVYAPVDKTADHSNSKDSLVMTDNTVTGDFLNTGLGEAKYFVDELEKGITVNGVTFTKDNTAVYLAGTDDEQIAFFAGQKYVFEVDEENVFPKVVEGRGVLTALKHFAGKNVIMPSGNYGNMYFSFPANYYGTNFGIDPNDKSGATEANGYDWTLNGKWGVGGETKIGTTNLTTAVVEGDVVFDGFTMTHRYYDDARTTIGSKPVNVTFKNLVVAATNTSAVTDEGRTFTISTPLARNGSSGNSAGTINDATLGKKYNDSFTLKNVRVINCGHSKDFMNEYVCANVTYDNLYLDQTTALKARNVMGFVKLGGNNTTFHYTVKNSNFRNASDASSMWQFNVFQNAPAPLNAQIPAGYTSEVEFTNNIFYNAVTGGGNIAYVHHAGYLTKLNFSDNRIINSNTITGTAINVKNLNTDTATCLLDGNVTINNNTLKGWTTAIINDLGWGDANPQITNVDNHKYGDGVASGNANCQQTADVRYYCEGCDTYGADCQYFKDVTGGTGNHVWDEGVYNNDATCTEDGTKHVTCTVDGCGEEDDIAAPGTKVDHKFNDADYVANNDANCYKAGTETAECAYGCGEKDTRTNETKYPATNAHVWGEYTYNNDATYGADGTKTAECTVDGCTAKNTITAEGTKLPAPPAKDAADTFKDVKAGKWYKKAVDHAVTYGLISGVSADNFGLDVTINRGMFITILARVAGVDTTAGANNVATKFTDVEKGRYYTAAIKWASENGIVAGMTETTFAPTASITRQQLAVMINNFAKNQKVELKAVENAVTFADAGEIAGWAKDAVVACQKANIINGYNEGGKMTFKPTASATRAEAAQMLYVFHANFYLA